MEKEISLKRKICQMDSLPQELLFFIANRYFIFSEDVFFRLMRQISKHFQMILSEIKHKYQTTFKMFTTSGCSNIYELTVCATPTILSKRPKFTAKQCRIMRNRKYVNVPFAEKNALEFRRFCLFYLNRGTNIIPSGRSIAKSKWSFWCNFYKTDRDVEVTIVSPRGILMPEAEKSTALHNLRNDVEEFDKIVPEFSYY